MSANPNPLPLPKRARHQRFAELLLLGASPAEAYLGAGYRAKAGNSAEVAACRLAKRRDVADYLAAQRAASATATTMTLIEKREFLARVKRVGIGDLDHSPGSPTGDLIAAVAVNESEMGSSVRITRMDVLKAIEIDTKLAGEDPEVTALEDLARAIQGLGSQTPLPTGRL